MQQVAVFNTTPNAKEGGIWQSGIGTAADAEGNIYVATGNGTFDANLGGTDYSDCFLRLTTSSGIAVADYFSPYNQGIMGADDLDLGSGGVVVLPTQPGPVPNLLVGGGKTGALYLVNRADLGGYGPGSDNIVQELENVLTVSSSTQVGLRGGPAYWNGQVYVSGVADTVKAFELSEGLLSTFPLSQSPTKNGYPGTTPTVSSNGMADGIVWTLETDGFVKNTPAVLHAYDALNLGDELYNSSMAGSRDTAGAAVKFTVPTIVNGKVFVPTQTELDFYGLLP
jgi:hypothetical protein